MDIQECLSRPLPLPVASGFQRSSVTSKCYLLKIPVELQLQIVEEVIGADAEAQVPPIMLTCHQLWDVGKRVLSNTPFYKRGDPVGPWEVEVVKRKAPLVKRLYGNHVKEWKVDVPVLLCMHWDDDFSVIKRQMEADWLHPFLHLGLWMQQPGPFPQVTIPVYANVADITKHLHSLHTEAAASPTPLTLWNYGMHMFPLTHEYLWRQWKAYGITSADKLILCLEGFVPVAEPSNRFGYHICVLATASIIAAVIAWNPPVKEICLTGLGTYHALFEEVWQDIPVQYPQEDEDDSDFRNHAFYNLLRNYPFKYWQVLHLMDYDGENVVVGPKRTNEFLYGQRSEMAWQQKVWGAVFKRYRWELKA